jgi:hypothetical protein
VKPWLYPHVAVAAAEDTDQLRRAALMLHGLARADCDVILGQLDPVQRVAIEPLLEELAELGLPGDTALLQELLKTEAATAPVERKPVDVLAHAPAHDVERVLANEPPLIVARLLAAQDWPWKEAVLARTALPRQRRINEALAGLKRVRTTRRTPACDELLVNELVSRIGELPRNANRASAPSRGARWMQSLRRLANQGRQA